MVNLLVKAILYVRMPLQHKKLSNLKDNNSQVEKYILMSNRLIVS